MSAAVPILEPEADVRAAMRAIGQEVFQRGFDSRAAFVFVEAARSAVGNRDDADRNVRQSASLSKGPREPAAALVS